MRRSYLSGAEKRKKAEDKKQRELELQSKIRKIDSLFSATSSSTNSAASFQQNSNSESSVEAANAGATDQQNIASTSSSVHNENDINVESDADVLEGSNEFDQSVFTSMDFDSGQASMPDSDPFLPFPSDAELWKMDSNLLHLQSFWAKNGLFSIIE